MSIISIQQVDIGQVGQAPITIKMLTTDNLATITAAGYLNNSVVTGVNVSPLDFFQVFYSYNQSAGTATYGNFTLTISNGISTLVQVVDTGNVLLPVVSGDFAVFNGTSGQIKDSAQAPSNAANPFLVSSPGGLTINHIAQIADANGSIKDGGVLGTAASKASSSAAATVASVSGATVIGDFAQFSDVAGTIIDSGILASNLMVKNAVNTMAAGSSIVLAKVNGTEAANALTASGVAGLITTSSLTTAGGANYSITWTNTFISATSVVLLQLAGGTNTTENITMKVTPGAGTATLIIYNNTAATALNGTIFISYAVL